MRTGTKLIWAGFVVLLIAMAIMHNTDEPGDGGGACAILGFGVLIILLVGTWFERMSDRQDRRGRRDDHRSE